MTVINGEISNQLGAKLDGTVWLAAAYHRPVDNVLVLADWAATPLEDSTFSTDAIPGPARLRVEAGSVFAEWDIVVPDEGPVEVTSLMQDSIDYPEPVILAAQAAATRATQEANRAEAGAARVGSAEAVLDARDQATAAATTATGAATTATDQADRAGTEADRSKTEADRAIEQATAAAGSADAAHADAVATAADRVKTTADATATAADRVATAADRTATGQARSQTWAAADRAAGSATTATTQADRAKSEADRASAAADLADGAAVQAVTERVDALLDGAPEAYDTLSEIAEKLADQDDVASAMTAQIGQKVDRTSAGDRLYGTDAGGNQTQVQYANSATANTVAYRGTDGTLPVGEPTDSSHATTKAYVDKVKTTADAALPASKIQVVSALPASPVAGTIYLVTGA